MISKHFGLFFYVFWWLFWLAISNLQLADIYKTSYFIQSLYFTSVIFVVIGYISSNYLRLQRKVLIKNEGLLLRPYVRRKIKFLLVFSSLILIYSLHSSGALQLTFYEYFTLVRGKGSEGYLPGGSFITYFLKIVIYPILITVLLFSFSEPEHKTSKYYILMGSLCLALFSYIFQVNYPIILLMLMFFLSTFNKTVPDCALAKYRKTVLLSLIVLLSIICLSAFNRFGDNDIYGVFRHYFISYHTLGFKIFEYNYNSDDSILHQYTFGLSFLSSFDFLLAYFFKIFNYSEAYSSAIMENVNFNMDPVPVGGTNANAFGTYLFSFYRDFSFFGIVFYSWLYGFFLGKLNLRLLGGCKYSYVLYLYLLSMGVIGIYVSPLDYSYFWLVIIIVFFIKKKFVFNS